MKRTALALCLVMTGCGGSQQAQNAREIGIFKGASKACEDTYPALAGGMVAREVCLNNASLRFTDASWGVLRAERLAMAERVDRGEMSPSDMQVAIARLVYDMAERQKQHAAYVQAAHEASQAAAAPAWAALGIAGLGMAAPRPVATNVTTCNFIRGTAICAGN